MARLPQVRFVIPGFFKNRARPHNEYVPVIVVCAMCALVFVSEQGARKVRWCADCKIAARRLTKQRFAHTEAGRFVSNKYARSAKGKMTKGRYAEQHVFERRRDHQAANARELLVRHARPLRRRRCETPLCGTMFEVGLRGRARLCADCRRENKAYNFAARFQQLKAQGQAPYQIRARREGRIIKPRGERITEGKRRAGRAA